MPQPSNFIGGASVATGANVVTIQATDAAGNVASASYNVAVGSTAKSFNVDSAGNLLTDGTRTFEWDARNQLVAVTMASNRTEFTYDGAQRRVRTVEKSAGVVVSDVQALWCGGALCEERNLSTGVALRRFFAFGETIGSESRLFVTDHLRSVIAVTDIQGAVTGRFEYSPWGTRTVGGGSSLTDRGFSGHKSHSASGIAMTRYRAYDPSLARWASEDPAGSVDGPNEYAFVRSNPISLVDRDGLQASGIQTEAPVEYVEELPAGCIAPKRSCGCTASNPHASYSCACTGGGYQLTLWSWYEVKIYVRTTAYTPNWMIRLHEKGHHNDNVAALKDFLKKSGGTYPSLAACEAAGAKMIEDLVFQMKFRAKRRDTGWGLLCH
jgi:RHS repeat-associated protein